MQALSASAVLEAWERGLDAVPVQRALNILALACPEQDLDELANLSAGARDVKLVCIREATFGASLTGLLGCPDCGEQIEISLDACALRQPSAQEQSEIALGQYQVGMRAPNSTDLLTATDPDVARARLQVLRRCVLFARRDGVPAAFDDLPAEVLDAIEARMAEMDPLAEIRIAAQCPACGSQRSAIFDVGSFLWRELEVWAQRLLREVHALAVAYGWSERDILALSPLRRQCYLELVGA